MKVFRLEVFMADNEWSSHEDYQIMKNLAIEQFKKNSECITPDSTIVVTVHEHAGWWLAYTPNPHNEFADPIIVGTANDMASLSDEAIRFGEKFKKAKSEYMGSIRR